jgi:hypothetical protein
MGGMRRPRLFTLTAALSGVLCAAAAGVWVRSYFRADSVMRFRPERPWTTLWIDHRTMVTFKSGPVYEADSRRGGLRLLYLYSDGSYERTSQPAWIAYGPDDPGIDPLAAPVVPEWVDHAWAGFAIEHRPINQFLYNAPPGSGVTMLPAYVMHAVYTPWWFWAVLFAVLPASWWLRRRRAAGRRWRGLCLIVVTTSAPRRSGARNAVHRGAGVGPAAWAGGLRFAGALCSS